MDEIVRNRMIASELLQKAEACCDIDLATGLVCQPVIGRDGMDYAAQVGLTVPFSYDELIDRLFRGQLQVRSSTYGSGRRRLDRDALLDAYLMSRTSAEDVLYHMTTQRCYQFRYHLWQEPSDGHVHAYAICEDVTAMFADNERSLIHQTNENLGEQLSAVRNLHESLHSGQWTVRFNSSGELVSCRWSEQFRRMLGFSSREEFPDVLVAWADRIHAGDRQRVLIAFWDTVFDDSGQKTFDQEYRLRTKRGRYAWFRTAGRLSRRSDGSPYSFDGLFINTDEAHKATESLQKAIREAEKARRQAVLENEIISAVSRMYFAIYRIDLAKGTCEEVANGRPEPLLAARNGPADRMLAAFCESFVAQDYREAVTRFFDLSAVEAQMAQADTIEMSYLAADGNWHEARFIEKKRNTAGRLKELLFVTRIVSQEKQRELEQERLQIAYEAAEHASAAKSAFLFNMSHDIRTPMNAIMGYTNLMKQDLHDPEKLQHYQEKLHEAGEFLLSLINNVLDMAWIESGKMELDENYCIGGDIITGILEVFDVLAQEKNQKIIRSVSVTHKHIICDAAKMREIFSNIVSNAVKYTPPGGTIEIMTRELPCEREGFCTYETVIADNGIGISREYLPHLFETFTREKNTTLGKVAGTGLGMAIVKKLVDLMGGQIRVQSEVGKGTCFTITMTHRLADPIYYEKAENDSAQQSLRSFQGRHVLIAEDNALNAEIATAILEDMGFAVDLAEDGVLCVDRVEQMPAGTYDLVLMDIQMPNMDGFQAARMIRGLPDPLKAGMPIVAMTANAFAEDRSRALAAGMNEHLAKPIDVARLRAVLTQLLP